MEIPDKLRYSALRWGDEGRGFLAHVPGLVAELATRWSLTMGQPCSPAGATAYVARATRHDGSPAVLKVTFPHREARHEGAALRVYGGNGAIRLYDETIDDRGYAFLLEACEPGHPLAEEPDDEVIVTLAAAVLVRLWQPVDGDHPFELLAHLAAELSVAAEERFDRFSPAWDSGLVRERITGLRELPRTAQKVVLLHQDFHPRNILSAQREPWLAIDPSPSWGIPPSTRYSSLSRLVTYSPGTTPLVR